MLCRLIVDPEGPDPVYDPKKLIAETLSVLLSFSKSPYLDWVQLVKRTSQAVETGESGPLIEFLVEAPNFVPHLRVERLLQSALYSRPGPAEQDPNRDLSTHSTRLKSQLSQGFDGTLCIRLLIPHGYDDQIAFTHRIRVQSGGGPLKIKHHKIAPAFCLSDLLVDEALSPATERIQFKWEGALSRPAYKPPGRVGIYDRYLVVSGESRRCDDG